MLPTDRADLPTVPPSCFLFTILLTRQDTPPPSPTDLEIALPAQLRQTAEPSWVRGDDDRDARAGNHTWNGLRRTNLASSLGLDLGIGQQQQQVSDTGLASFFPLHMSVSAEAHGTSRRS